jgi:phosphotransferase system IIB component
LLTVWQYNLQHTTNYKKAWVDWVAIRLATQQTTKSTSTPLKSKDNVNGLKSKAKRQSHLTFGNSNTSIPIYSPLEVINYDSDDS